MFLLDLRLWTKRQAGSRPTLLLLQHDRQWENRIHSINGQKYCCRPKYTSCLVSLEMASVQLIMRMISSETGISSEKLRKGTLTDEEWERLLVTFPIWRRLLFISMKHPLFRYSTLERNAVDWLCSMVYGLSWSTTFS